VPHTLREGSLALGAPEWKTSLLVTLQAAANGILTGFLLGLARASGETAPLLFTALGNEHFEVLRLVQGGLQNGQNIGAILLNLVEQPADSLPLTLWKYAQQPYAERVEQSWAVALVLMLFVLLINILVRVWSHARTSRLQGG
jgi:phosphate transport system permease protein